MPCWQVPALLRLFGASDATLPYGVEYGRIYILGSVFVLTVMGMNPFITTQGFAKISMLTTVIGAVHSFAGFLFRQKLHLFSRGT